MRTAEDRFIYEGQLRNSLVNAGIAIIVLQLADIVSTLLFLHVGGVEANPLMAPFVGRGAVTVAFLFVIKTAIAWRLLRRWTDQGVARAIPKAWALVGFYGVTVLSNVLVFAQLVGR